VDPADLGRSYDAVVRVNSQSGKGGVSFLLQQEANLQLPRRLQIEFSGTVQKISDATGREIKSREIVELFEREYFAVNAPFEFHHSSVSENADQVEITINSQFRDKPLVLTGRGNGPIDAAAHKGFVAKLAVDGN